MKKLFSVAAVALLLAFVFGACEHSDCLCKYYSGNDELIGYDSWDGAEVNATECANMENDNTVEVNGDEVVAANVACSTSW